MAENVDGEASHISTVGRNTSADALQWLDEAQNSAADEEFKGQEGTEEVKEVESAREGEAGGGDGVRVDVIVEAEGKPEPEPELDWSNTSIERKVQSAQVRKSSAAETLDVFTRDARFPVEHGMRDVADDAAELWHRIDNLTIDDIYDTGQQNTADEVDAEVEMEAGSAAETTADKEVKFRVDEGEAQKERAERNKKNSMPEQSVQSDEGQLVTAMLKFPSSMAPQVYKNYASSDDVRQTQNMTLLQSRELKGLYEGRSVFQTTFGDRPINVPQGVEEIFEDAVKRELGGAR